MTEMKSLTLNDKTYDCFVDSVARELAAATAVIKSAAGESITVSDTGDNKLYNLKIYGKTIQDGTPSPVSPADLVSPGDNGSITASVSGGMESQSLTIATPNGLPGIPVESDGNYTDADGQQWICDEIDLARGMYIKRIGKKVFDGTEAGWWETGDLHVYRIIWSDVSGGWEQNKSIASHFIYDNNRAYEGEAGYFAIDQKGLCYFAQDKASLPEFKDWLSTNNVTVVCPMVTPIETPLSEEELATYNNLRTYRGGTTVSNNDDAYMELDYAMDAKTYIDRMLGVAAMRLAEVNLPASQWAGSDSLYSQVVTLSGITEYSKVDLLPSVEQLAIFHNKDVAFVTENEDGVVTVYAIGDKPTQDYTMQVQITEVEV